MRRALIANRGEIALRAVRACLQLRLESATVISSAHANSPHRWAADQSVCIGSSAPQAVRRDFHALALRTIQRVAH